MTIITQIKNHILGKYIKIRLKINFWKLKHWDMGLKCRNLKVMMIQKKVKYNKASRKDWFYLRDHYLKLAKQGNEYVLSNEFCLGPGELIHMICSGYEYEDQQKLEKEMDNK